MFFQNTGDSLGYGTNQNMAIVSQDGTLMTDATPIRAPQRDLSYDSGKIRNESSDERRMATLVGALGQTKRNAQFTTDQQQRPTLPKRDHSRRRGIMTQAQSTGTSLIKSNLSQSIAQ